MSLLNAEAKPCELIIKSSVPDKRGGSVTMYMGTMTFDAVITETDSSYSTKEIGNNTVSAQKVKVMFKKGIPLALNSIFKTLKDGKTYKCIAEPIKCAASASVQYDMITAEEWSLPNG